MLSSALRSLPISRLVPSPVCVRTGRVDVGDLVDSFAHTPQLQNVVVRPIGRGRYEVIAGQRRLAAAKKLGWSHLNALVVEATDERAELLALEENLRRKAMRDEPEAMVRLLQLYEAQAPTRHGGDRRSAKFATKLPRGNLKSSLARVAEVAGQSERDVRRRVKIETRGVPALRVALAEGRVTVNEADRIAGLAPDEQVRRLASHDVSGAARRALGALQFAARVLGEQAVPLPGVLVEELRAAATAVGDGAKRLKPARGPEVARSAAGAVDFAEKTYNRKLAPVALVAGKKRPHFVAKRPFVSATFTSIAATCPDSCAFKPAAPGAGPGGCYASAGFGQIKGAALDGGAHGFTGDAINEAEAAAIDAAFDGGAVPQDGARGGRDLRLHVGGDCVTQRGARHLAGATRRWRGRGGGTVWTFTHAWRSIPRSAWGEVNVLASVEKPADIEAARRRGYAAAVVVEDFPNEEKAFRLPGSKASVLPCPAETQGTTCAQCRLCLDHDLLVAGNAIAFKVHGRDARVVREKLVQLGKPRS